MGLILLLVGAWQLLPRFSLVPPDTDFARERPADAFQAVFNVRPPQGVTRVRAAGISSAAGGARVYLSCRATNKAVRAALAGIPDLKRASIDHLGIDSSGADAAAAGWDAEFQRRLWNNKLQAYVSGEVGFRTIVLVDPGRQRLYGLVLIA